MFPNSQEKSGIRNYHIDKLREFERESRTTGKKIVYGYGLQCLQEEYERISKNKAPIFDLEYELNPFQYQYDLELFIFLHYHKLVDREETLASGKKRSLIKENGITGFDRYEHLLNAISIRWPTKTSPSGTKIGACVRTPWLDDVAYSLSENDHTIVYGGAGQGKTFGMIVFMSMIFDFFYHYKSGAQCSFSSVSQQKLESAPWSFVNKLYPVDLNRPAFSSSVGLARKCADYTYKRVGINNKIIEEGGTFRGVLLSRVAMDNRVVDKLTGCHDPVARCYLLDEMQSTPDAPINALANMFMHPRHTWFYGSGNYEVPNDLLGVNTIPDAGWNSVDENTHMYKGTLKSTTESLGKSSNIIHFNNELSPAMTHPELATVFPHLPNKFKKDKNYPTPESQKTIAYKRFWIGFRYEKESSNKEKILTAKLLEESRACEAPKFIEPPVNVFSFDSAPASVDRNINNILSVGFEQVGELRKLIVAPACLRAYQKPESELTYYKETTDNIINDATVFGIESGNGIMDWTNRTGLLETLNDKHFACHHMIYSEKLPNKRQVNKITKELEDIIELETIKTFIGRLERKVTHYAHEKVFNRITLGAYLFRYFVEKGCVRGVNASILDSIPDHKGFEKEMLSRCFQMHTSGVLTIDSKDKFKEVNGFSPDVLDTFFQAFYYLYVIAKVNPAKNSMGTLKRENQNKGLERYKKATRINNDKIRF